MEHLQKKLKELLAQKLLLKKALPEEKNRTLEILIQKLKSAQEKILFENKKDCQNYQKSHDFKKSFLDRLTLNEKRIEDMCHSISSIKNLPDPVGEIFLEKTLPNKLKLKQKRIPFGIIFIIFESRPNVIIDAFSLAFKSGNIAILKGGKESKFTSAILYQLILEAITEVFDISNGNHLFWGIADSKREEVDFLLRQNNYIDLVIPRGGEKLIQHISQVSCIPVIKNDRGLCHLYIHSEANLSMALDILINAKTQRPGVCNSVETLLIDEQVAPQFLRLALPQLLGHQVKLFVCPKTKSLLPTTSAIEDAEDENFNTEYLDLIINIKTVSNFNEAIGHINRHSSHHSESIITENEAIANEFFKRLDSACLYWNASTRFTDGGEFGMGGEIGISTQKLHVYGPVGLTHLTTLQWNIEGQGQIRR